MKVSRTSLAIGVSLALFFGISLFLRIYLPYHDIFVNDWIKFSSNDAYYHMRMVDNFAHNFPRVIQFDPYFLYPGGSYIGGIYFFDWLLAGIIWVIGFGSPSQHLIDVVGAYYPVVLAGLAVIPVYFIGKNLFGRGAGLIAACLIAILPGEFMGRSILAFTDNHIAESLFTAIVMLLLILTIRSARQKGLTYEHLLKRDWAVSTRPLVYAALSGIALGVYLITWAGGLLFVFIITAFLIVQFMVDHVRRRSTDYLAVAGGILFPVGLAISYASAPAPFYRAAMLVAILIPLGASLVSRLMSYRKLAPALYPLAMFAMLVAGLAVFFAIAPSMVGTMLGQFGIFSPSGPALTTLEAQPLFGPPGAFSLTLAWGNFTVSFFLSLVGILAVAYLVIKRGTPELALFLAWSLVILAATAGQRRFAYYFAVNVALLSGYISWQVIWLPGLRRVMADWALARERASEKRARARKKRRQSLTIYHVNTALAIIVIVAFVFVPNVPGALITAQSARFAPSNAWMSAMDWLRNNTPEPFGNPNYYYDYYAPPAPGSEYAYPKSAYGVTSWWDYGYWISRVAHRLPSSNPSQDANAIKNVTQVFLAPDEAQGNRAMQKIKSSYVVMDNQITTSKFWAVITWAGKAQSDYFEEYYVTVQGKGQLARLFYPEYYRSLAVRLYNFDGKAVTPANVLVVSWQPKTDANGRAYKELIEAKMFNSYPDATIFVQSQKTGNFKIVGNNPFVSPVPLEALKDYKLVYSSPGGINQQDVGPVPELKIFQFAASSAAAAQK